jgi:hypothetical protein
MGKENDLGLHIDYEINDLGQVLDIVSIKSGE